MLIKLTQCEFINDSKVEYIGYNKQERVLRIYFVGSDTPTIIMGDEAEEALEVLYKLAFNPELSERMMECLRSTLPGKSSTPLS